MQAPVGREGIFLCPRCGDEQTSQVFAEKVYKNLAIFAGRRGGKSRIGAEAALEEMQAPGCLGWICGPTFKVLHDATIPAISKLLNPDDVANWDSVHMELTMTNDHVVQFRSLDDPERGRGQGPHWGWFDEATQMVERAWDVFRPSLTENLGNCFFTMSPFGFDWCYRRFWKPAEQHIPGFWARRFATMDNPWIREHCMDEIEAARATMSHELFEQEYMGNFVNFTGSVYAVDLVQEACL